MSHQVAKVAKRFVVRGAMTARNSESRKEEETLDLRLQLSDVNARLKSMEEALVDCKARECKGREHLVAEQERHAQEV